CALGEPHAVKGPAATAIVGDIPAAALQLHDLRGGSENLVLLGGDARLAARAGLRKRNPEGRGAVLYRAGAGVVHYGDVGTVYVGRLEQRRLRVVTDHQDVVVLEVVGVAHLELRRAGGHRRDGHPAGRGRNDIDRIGAGGAGRQAAIVIPDNPVLEGAPPLPLHLQDIGQRQVLGARTPPGLTYLASHQLERHACALLDAPDALGRPVSLLGGQEGAHRGRATTQATRHRDQ